MKNKQNNKKKKQLKKDDEKIKKTSTMCKNIIVKYYLYLYDIIRKFLSSKKY